MKALSIYAGAAATAHINQHGLQADDIKAMIGASGGPKWFVLFGLDKYLFGEFFKGRQQPLNLMGSSAGAWRMACLAQDEPVAAIERLAHHYSRQRYSEKPNMREISREARRLLDIVLSDEGTKQVVNNPVFKLHIVADRARGIIRSDQRHLLALGLLLCGVSNSVSRKALQWYFERIIFHNAVAGDSAFKPDDMPTQYVALHEINLREALMASGSIPIAMEGVKNIAGAPQGVYRDGGITDYHFDMPFHQGDGLVMYPHFYRQLIPGWFDKLLPWRKSNPANFDNVVLLTPSAEFVAQLPYGKIPDRKDFEHLDFASRQKYWAQVLSESEQLAAEFAQILDSGEIIKHLRPLQNEPGARYASNSRSGVEQ